MSTKSMISIAVICLFANVASAQRTRTVRVTSEPELRSAVASLRSGDVVEIVAGTYTLTQVTTFYSVDHVTFRGVNADGSAAVSDAVIIQSTGLNGLLFGFWMQSVQDIHFENLWVRNFRTHGFIVNGDGTERIFWRNVHLSDIGEHFIKVNPGFDGNGVDDGIIEDSLFEFTTHAFHNFTGAIDIHRGKNWIIRKNTFRNFWHPDTSVGPVLQFKNFTQDIVVEQNFFLNNFMDIAMGFNEPNIRGVVRNNMIARTATMPNGMPGGDVAIAVWDSRPDGQSVGTEILNNTIWLVGSYPFAIDYRFEST
jgi:hypothetical protein